MKDLLWINRWDGRRKNSAKEKQTIGQSFISNYNITDFKQVLPELWVGLAMNIGSENSRYVTFIPPTTNEVIKLRISDHPSNENEWGEKELTGLPNRRYSIVIFSNKSMPNESNKDVKYLPWRSYSAQNIPVHEITFNRFYLGNYIPVVFQMTKDAFVIEVETALAVDTDIIAYAKGC